MIIQGQVGPIATKASIGAGTQPAARLGNMGELILSQLHGRYYESSYRGATFSAANSAGVTTSVGTATTYVGICLSNPITSQVNLVLTKLGFSFLVAFTAAATIGIMTGYNSGTNVTHTTPLTVRNNIVGTGPVGYGLVDSSATLPTTPALTLVFGAGLTGAITTEPVVWSKYDVEGSIVLPPGAYAAVYTSTAGGASGFAGSMQWEEVPL